MLTSLPDVQALAAHYLPWQILLPLLGVWCYLLDGMFIGATRGTEMRNSMAVAAVGYGLTLFTLPWLGNHGLWLALAVFYLYVAFRYGSSGDGIGGVIRGLKPIIFIKIIELLVILIVAI